MGNRMRLLVGLAAVVGACAPSESVVICPSGGCAALDGSGDARASGDGSRPAMDASRDGVVDVARTCTEGAACAGGVCVGGACCASANVCGAACCGGAQTCFASVCVTPGRSCRTGTDCEAGSYCESALGDHVDAGVSDGGVDGARVCSAATPAGRCLALPPRCATGDGGVADAGTNCISRCEYRPPTGQLDAVVAWSWGQPTPPARFPEYIDVWSTPAVGRVYDANCDGHVDSLDPPDLVFVSGRSIDSATGRGTCCQCTGTTPTACATGVLRVLDGRTGADLLAVRSATSTSAGFAGVSVALGDLDGDRTIDIAAVTGEGYVVILDRNGAVLRTSDMPIPGHDNAAFGWGGGLSIADMDGDGAPEIAYGATVFTTMGGRLTLRFTAPAAVGTAGGPQAALSTLADVDGASDNHLELVLGRAAFRANGAALWARMDLTDGYPAVADLDGDRRPEVVLITSGHAYILDGETGATRLGPATLPGMGAGGAPTIADFDGDGHPEIGVAQANFYSVLKPDFARMQLNVLWRAENHDLSSSVTGSTVFDFEGDGASEVLYADECYVWVFDGRTGAVRFAGLTTSFTGTEASIVADVDGDGHAEIVSISNGADPGPMGWRCNMPPWNTADPMTGRPAWVAPPGFPSYRGVRVFRDASRSWVGTRPMWNQHAYHVTNVCVSGDNACADGSYDGQIPRMETRNWTLPWLNNFRQNVQQSGLFNAPDATVTLAVGCAAPPNPPRLVASVRNLGEATLPANVVVGFYVQGDDAGVWTLLGTAPTTAAVFPGAAQEVAFMTPTGSSPDATYMARIVVDAMHPSFHECRTDNNESAPTRSPCPG